MQTLGYFLEILIFRHSSNGFVKLHLSVYGAKNYWLRVVHSTGIGFVFYENRTGRLFPIIVQSREKTSTKPRTFRFRVGTPTTNLTFRVFIGFERPRGRNTRRENGPRTIYIALSQNQQLLGSARNPKHGKREPRQRVMSSKVFARNRMIDGGTTVGRAILPLCPAYTSSGIVLKHSVLQTLDKNFNRNAITAVCPSAKVKTDLASWPTCLSLFATDGFRGGELIFITRRAKNPKSPVARPAWIVYVDVRYGAVDRVFRVCVRVSPAYR